MPILYSADINRSISYYVDVLGFDKSWVWGEPVSFGSVSKNNVEIFFCKEDQGNPGTWAFVFLDDIDAFHEKIKSKGAKIIVEPTNREWGVREMLVEDPDGHCIRFGQNALLSDKEITAQRLPANIRIVHRIPSPQELSPIAIAIGWASAHHELDFKEPSPSIVHALVAEDTETNQIVGSVFALSDGPGFYYVKNLMVHPKWQRQRVGSALMEELINWLEQNVKGEASVYLHTGENLAKFYKQFGFGPAFGMYRMIKNGGS